MCYARVWRWLWHELYIIAENAIFLTGQLKSSIGVINTFPIKNPFYSSSSSSFGTHLKTIFANPTQSALLSLFQTKRKDGKGKFWEMKWIDNIIVISLPQRRRRIVTKVLLFCHFSHNWITTKVDDGRGNNFVCFYAVELFIIHNYFIWRLKTILHPHKLISKNDFEKWFWKVSTQQSNKFWIMWPHHRWWQWDISCLMIVILLSDQTYIISSHVSAILLPLFGRKIKFQNLVVDLDSSPLLLTS